MISKEEVERISKLARLELTGKEVEKMQKDLSEILDYFNLLKRADTGQHPVLTKSQHRVLSETTRKDEVVSSHDIADKLIGATPDKKEGYIKVKTIL